MTANYKRTREPELNEIDKFLMQAEAEEDVYEEYVPFKVRKEREKYEVMNRLNSSSFRQKEAASTEDGDENEKLDPQPTNTRGEYSGQSRDLSLLDQAVALREKHSTMDKRALKQEMQQLFSFSGPTHFEGKS
jgi:hypothetical protein